MLYSCQMSEQAKHLETTQNLTREDLVNAYQQLYKGDLTGETPEQMLAQKLSEAGDYTTLLIKFAQQHYPDFSGTPAEMEDEVSSHEDIASVDVVFDLLNELQSRLETDRSKNITTIPLPIVAIPPNEYLIKLKEKPNLETTKKYEFQLQERLKILYDTLLLLGLSQPEDFQLYEGQVTATMMRQTPYIIADIETLNRLVCICNEVGNKTFVFDRSQIIKQFGEDEYVETLANSTKNDLKTLIEQSAQDNTSGIIGTGFVWGKTAASKLAALLSGSKEFNLESLQSKEKKPKKELDANTIYLTPGPDGLADYTKPDGTTALVGSIHQISKKLGYDQQSAALEKKLTKVTENILVKGAGMAASQVYYYDSSFKRIPDYVETILDADESGLAETLNSTGDIIHVGPLNAIFKKLNLGISRDSKRFGYALLKDPTTILKMPNGTTYQTLYILEKIVEQITDNNSKEYIRRSKNITPPTPEDFDIFLVADENDLGYLSLDNGQSVTVTTIANAARLKGYHPGYLKERYGDQLQFVQSLRPNMKVGLKTKSGIISSQLVVLDQIPNRFNDNTTIIEAGNNNTGIILDEFGKQITIGSKSVISLLSGHGPLYITRNPDIADLAKLKLDNIVLRSGGAIVEELYILEKVPSIYHLEIILAGEDKLGDLKFANSTIHIGAITQIASSLGKSNTFIQNKQWLQQLCKYPDSTTGLKYRTGIITDLYVLEWAQEAMEKYGKNKKIVPNHIELDVEDLALIESRKQQVLLENMQRKNTVDNS